jgi:hypothetical protein
MIELVAVETQAENSRNASGGIVDEHVPSEEKGYVRWLSGCDSDGRIKAANRLCSAAPSPRKNILSWRLPVTVDADVNMGYLVDAEPCTEWDIDNSVTSSDLAERSRKVRERMASDLAGT